MQYQEPDLEYEDIMDTIAALIVDNCCHTNLFCREGFFENLKKRVAAQIAQNNPRKMLNLVYSCSSCSPITQQNASDTKTETSES